MGGERGKGREEGEEDEVMSVARELAKEANVLCFDEFQVTDIADAMILRRLLEGLLQCGVVCVITSKCVYPLFFPTHLSFSPLLLSFPYSTDDRMLTSITAATPTTCTKTASNAHPSSPPSPSSNRASK